MQSVTSKWKPRWSQAYLKGYRGVIAIYIQTRELDETYNSLKEKGVDVSFPKPENIIQKTSSKVIETMSKLLNLGKNTQKSLPQMRYLNLPPLPGTDLEISFIEYNQEIEERMQDVMVPNSRENGIMGIKRIKIYLPKWKKSIEFLSKVFPQLAGSTTQFKVDLKESDIVFYRSEPDEPLAVKLETIATDKRYTGGKFQINNLEVKTGP
jgi:hypothetical protein